LKGLFRIILLSTLCAGLTFQASYGQDMKREKIGGQEFNVYEVKRSGISLQDISTTYKLDLETLKKFNADLVGKKLRAGTKVYYPEKMMDLRERRPIHAEDEIVSPPATEVVQPVEDFQPAETFDLQAGHLQIETRYNLFQKNVQKISVKGDDGSVRTFNSTLADFKLDKYQAFAYVPSREVFLDPGTLPTGAQVMKGVYVAVPADTTAFGSQVQFQLAFIKAFPVAYNPEERQWGGSIRMKCYPIDPALLGQPGTIELQEPIAYNLTVNGIDLGDRAISRINTEVPEDYTIRETLNVHDMVRIGVRQLGETDEEEKAVEVIPYIKVTCDKETIQGYGIQTASVNVMLIGTTSPAPMAVPLQLKGKGELSPKAVMLSGDNPLQTVTLRSEGGGSVQIEAEAAILSLPATVSFGFPWSFLISAFIGAVVGSLIRILLLNKTGFDIRSFIAGILIGIAVALCYWAIGLNLLDITITVNYLNEAAVIAFSLLGGLAGAVKFKKLAGG
jgi:hypothetical protein